MVTHGILGYRNADITVRERRRYTDLIREDELIAKSADNINEDLLGRHQGAFRRINGITPSESKGQAKTPSNDQELEINGQELEKNGKESKEMG